MINMVTRSIGWQALWRWGPPLGLMSLIFIASATPGDDLPQFGGWDWVLRKGGHALGYALLAGCLLRAVAWKHPVTRRNWMGAVMGAVAYAITDEVHQAFIPGRHPTPVDVAIDFGGALIGSGVYAGIRAQFLRAKLTKAKQQNSS